MLPFIRHEVVVRQGWMGSAEFADLVALSQVTPGPISINCATYIGYAVSQSALGAAAATLALVLPSMAAMLGICMFVVRFKNNASIQAALAALRLVTAGLIAAAALTLMNADNFHSYKSVLIFALAFFALRHWKLHPLLIIGLAGAAGAVWF